MKKTEKELYALEIKNVKSLNASYDEIIHAIETTEDANIVFQDKDNSVIVALVNTYHACLAIGSENWCIASVYYGGSPGEGFWEFYDGPEDRRQYIVWTMNHPSEDYQMVGCTTNESLNNFYCAYNFPNMPFNMDNFIKNVPVLSKEMFFGNDKFRKQ
jgi:hypothetical protein